MRLRFETGVSNEIQKAFMKRERVEALLQEAEELTSKFMASRKTSQKR